MSYDLERFVAAQEGVYDRALAEITAGHKRTHWMWFVFPQLAGLGSSPTAQAYAISGAAEARAYLADPLLGPRLVECARALLTADHPERVFGYPDDLKLCSSMTLFAAVADDPAVFTAVIDRFCGTSDQRTLDLLARPI